MVNNEKEGIMNKWTLAGNDLSVIKEAKVKVDMNATQNQMSDMLKMCPIMEAGTKQDNRRTSRMVPSANRIVWVIK